MFEFRVYIMIITTPATRRLGGFFSMSLVAPDLLDAMTQALAIMVDAPRGSIFILDELEGFE